MSKFKVRLKEQHKFRRYYIKHANSNVSDTAMNCTRQSEVGGERKW